MRLRLALSKLQQEGFYVKKLPYLLLVTITAAVWLMSCDKDCPTCPPVECTDCTYDGRLYVAMDEPTPGVYVFDTKTDSLIDSVLTPGSTVFDVSVSPDGYYFTANIGGGRILLFEASTMQLIAELPGYGRGEFLGNSDELLIRGQGGIINVYLLPTLSVKYSGPPGVPYNARPTKTGREFVGVWSADSIVLVDIDSLRITKTWQVTVAESQLLRKFDVNTDGQYLCGIVETGEGCATYILDLELGQVTIGVRIEGPFGDVRIDPEGHEAWVADSAPYSFGSDFPDVIYVIDAIHGTLLYSVSLRQILTPRGIPPDAQGMEFTPDGSAVYVRTGFEGVQGGSVIRIDTKTKRITNVLFPEFDRLPTSMAIGPKPISK